MSRTITFEAPDQICISCKKLGTASVSRYIVPESPDCLPEMWVGVPDGWIELQFHRMPSGIKRPPTNFAICPDCYEKEPGMTRIVRETDPNTCSTTCCDCHRPIPKKAK